MNPVLQQTIIYAAIFLLMLFFANWYMGGYFVTYIKVRASRGKKLMAKIRTHIDDYHTAADLMGDFIRYRIRGSKDKKLLLLSPGAAYRVHAINCIDIDEEKNAVMLRDYSVAEGFDAESFDNLFRRCLTKPTLMSFDMKQVIFLLVIAIIIAGIAAYFGYTNADKIAVLQDSIGKGVV